MISFKSRYGAYALVTGASAGIGAEFAVRLAERGLNLVLVARRKDKMNLLADELRSAFQISVLTLSVDLANEGSVEQIARETADLQVGLIVLNEAALTVGSFLKNSLVTESNVLRINSLATMQLAHHFGNLMKKRLRGGIVFVASMAGHCAAPYQANFAASKAYVLSLGQALNVELKSAGVHVTVLSPGFVDTEGVQNVPGVRFRKMPISTMETEPVVRAALDALGKKTLVIPGFINKVVDFLIKHATSRSLGTKMFGRMLSKALDKESLS
jgi:hypothetical protein